MNRTLTTLAVLACTAPVAAQLQEFSFAQPFPMPQESEIACIALFQFDPNASIEYFDIRQPPSAQPTAEYGRSFVVSGDCDVGGSAPRTIALFSECDGGFPDLPPSNLRLAYAGDPVQTGLTLYTIGGIPVPELSVPGFMPGDSVGPSAPWTNFLQLGSAFYYSDPQNAGNNAFRDDLDFVSDGIIIGVEITEPDGVHYGWIEIQRAPDASPTQVDVCQEEYFVTRYAYQLTPGVPALVTDPNPCTPDTNADGSLTPADFNAWIIAFNQQAPECDQNADGLCTPADFNAWIQNYNAGC